MFCAKHKFALFCFKHVNEDLPVCAECVILYLNPLEGACAMRCKIPKEVIANEYIVKANKFIVAAAKSSVKELLNLERNGENPYHRDIHGWDALFYAVNEGRIDMVRFLFSRYNFDINAKDRYGRTALMVAAARGNIRMIDTLIELGADLNAVDHDGWKAFHYAVWCSQPNAVSYFINRYCVNPDTPDHHGVTGLIIASDNGDQEMVETLLKNGARLDVTDHEGKSVIHYLSLPEYAYSYIYMKRSPLVCLDLGFGGPATAARLSPVYDTDWIERKIKLLRKFIKEHNLDVNKKDKKGNTPLIDSLVNCVSYIDNGKLSIIEAPPIVQALINLGANPLIRNNEGMSAIDIARIKGIFLNCGGMVMQGNFHYKFQF